jgi:prephenate dehydratase
MRIFSAAQTASATTIATLGPAGTSSEQAARYIAGELPGNVALFESYEGAADYMMKHPLETILLVANAYDRVNHFYISRVMEPAAGFFYDTPPYVIASRDPDILRLDTLNVASHPAPSHLVEDVLPTKSIRIQREASTVLAAEAAANGEADACLTTLPASLAAGLHLIAIAMPAIPMFWTLFVSRELNHE